MSAFRVLCASDPSSSTLSRVCAPCCRGAREPSIVKLHAPVRPPSWLVTLNLSRNPLTAMDPTMFHNAMCFECPDFGWNLELSVQLLSDLGNMLSL